MQVPRIKGSRLFLAVLAILVIPILCFGAPLLDTEISIYQAPAPDYVVLKGKGNSWYFDLEEKLKVGLSTRIEERQEEIIESTGSTSLKIKIHDLTLLLMPTAEAPASGQEKKFRASADISIYRKKDSRYTRWLEWRDENLPQNQWFATTETDQLIDALSGHIVSVILQRSDPVEFSAQRRPRIAVVEFANKTRLESEREYGKALSAMLTTQLKRESQFIIMERMSHKEPLETWKEGTRDSTDTTFLQDLDAILIGDVTVLDGGRIEVDARLMGLDGRLIASASQGGLAKELREVATSLASELQIAFLRPFTGKVAVAVEKPDLAKVEFFPVLGESHLPEEDPPAAATSAISVSQDLLDEFVKANRSDDSTATKYTGWRTRSGILEIENLLQGWYSIRVSHPGYLSQGTDGRQWTYREQDPDKSADTAETQETTKATNVICATEDDRACLVFVDSESGLPKSESCLVYVGEQESATAFPDGQKVCEVLSEGSPFIQFGDMAKNTLAAATDLEGEARAWAEMTSGGKIQGIFEFDVPPHLSRCLEYSISSMSLDLEETARERYEELQCHEIEETEEVITAKDILEGSYQGLRSKDETVDLLRKTQCYQIQASATSHDYIGSFEKALSSNDDTLSPKLPESPKLPAGYYKLTFSHPDFEEATIVSRISNLAGQARKTRISLTDVNFGAAGSGQDEKDGENQLRIALRQEVHLRRKLHGPFSLKFSHKTVDPISLRRGGSSLRIVTAGTSHFAQRGFEPGQSIQRNNMIAAISDSDKVELRLASDKYLFQTETPGLEKWEKHLNFVSSCFDDDRSALGSEAPPKIDSIYTNILSASVNDLDSIRQERADGKITIDQPDCETIKTGFITAGLELEPEEYAHFPMPSECLPGLLSESQEPMSESLYRTLQRRLRDVDLLALNPDAISRLSESTRLREILTEFLSNGHAVIAFLTKEGISLEAEGGQSLEVYPRKSISGRRKIDFRAGDHWDELKLKKNRYLFRFRSDDHKKRYWRRTFRFSDRTSWREFSRSRNCWLFCPRSSRVAETDWPLNVDKPGYLMVWGDDIELLGEIFDSDESAKSLAKFRSAVEKRAVCQAKRLMYSRLGDLKWDEANCKPIQ